MIVKHGFATGSCSPPSFILDIPPARGKPMHALSLLHTEVERQRGARGGKGKG